MDEAPAWISAGMPGMAGLDAPDQGLGIGSHWFAFQIGNSDAEPQRRILSLFKSYSWKTADVFQISDGLVIRRWGTTLAVPASARPFGPGDVAFPFELGGTDTADFVLRLETAGPHNLHLQPVLAPEHAFVKNLQTKVALTWLFNGLMAVMAIYHLLVYFSLRDPAYLYFVGVIATSLGVNLAIGDGFQMLFQLDNPVETLNYFPRIGIASGAMWALFTAQALNLPARVAWMTRGLRIFAITALMLIAPLALLPVPYTLFTFFGMSSVAMFACITVGIVSWRSGYSPARLYLATWSVYFAFVGLQALSATTDFGLYSAFLANTGVAFQIIMFGLVLARRYALVNEELGRTHSEKIFAQAEALTAQKKALTLEHEAAETLQQKVNERTAELDLRTQEAEKNHTEAEIARKQAEQAREQAEQEHAEAEQARARVEQLDRQKTQFFQNISHELRTPLTLILNPLAEEAQQWPDNQNLVIAARNSRRLLRLVNQLLDFQKARAGKRAIKLGVMDLADFVRVSAECFEPSCHRKHTTLALQLDGAPMPAETEPRRIMGELDGLEKIVFNYLSNALKYAPRDSEIRIDLSRRDGKLRLSVSDRGEGIAEEDQRRLFEVFSQVDGSASREHEGTGLGLALVKQLAAAMHGQVGVDSEVGEGATFWLDLPELEASVDQTLTSLEEFTVKPWLLADGEEQHVTLPPQPALANPLDQANGAQNSSAEAPQILLVDDLLDMRELIGRILERAGYRVQLADQGTRALEMARVAPPDLVISDWMMPGMTGPELLKALRALPTLKHVPVVLLTAKSDQESKVNATLAGADAFLGKPFDEMELLATVRNLLSLKAREREVEELNRTLIAQGLARCFPPALLEGALRGEMELTQTPKVQWLSVLSARLSAFESQLRQLAPKDAGRLLDRYLEATSRVAYAHNGILTQFSGDRIDVIFGAPEPMDPDASMHSALFCALHMHQVSQELSACWKELGLPPPQICIGVHAGEALVGTIGSALRSEYTAIGATIVLAEKLSQAAAPGSVTLCAELAGKLPSGSTRPAGRMMLQGAREALQLAQLEIDPGGYSQMAGDLEDTA